MNNLVLPYEVARPMIKEADVLLFRHPERSHCYSLPPVGWWIARYSGGIHSHVGVASWNRDRLKCIEFREWRGGRSVTLSSQVHQNPGRIDVFRAMSCVEIPFVDYCEKKGHEGLNISSKQKNFTEQVALNITSEMDRLTGLPYGWDIIWKIAGSYLPFKRLAENNIKDDEPNSVFVCSSAVAYAFRKNYIDLVPYLADSSTKPADIARSPILQYLFTIGDI